MASWYARPTGNDTTGDGSSGNPYATLGKILTVYSGSDLVYIATGCTETITAAIVPLVGTAAAPTMFIGTDTSFVPLTDPASVANFPVIIMNNTANHIITASNNYFTIQNFTLDGGAGGSKAGRCFNGQAVNSSIINCKVTRWSAFGVLQQGDGGVTARVWATAGAAGSTHAIRSDGNAVVECGVNACPHPGFRTTTGFISNCVVTGLTGGSSIGAELAGNGAVRNLVAHNNGSDGLKCSWAGGTSSLRNNVLTNNGGYGINSTTALTFADADYNAFGINASANSSGRRLQIPAGAHDVDLDGDPYVNSGITIASLNDFFSGFMLKATSPGSVGRAAGYPAYLDVGAVQHQDSGGAATAFWFAAVQP